MRIAITGGIGSGKSSVLKMLKDFGYKVLSCDEVNSRLLIDSDYIAKIKAYFPEVVNNNIIDRKKLANIVFSDHTKLELLNSIAHTAIRNIISNNIDQNQINFIEVPLLFESNMQSDFDKVLLVTASKATRIARVKIRDGRSESEINAIIDNQIKEYDNQKVDYIITNDGDMNNLKKEVERYLCILRK